MAKAVQISITARQSVKRPAKEAESALADLGNRAAKAGEQILSIERARAAFEVVKKGAELATKAFEAMAKNSTKMAGEMAAVERATNKAWAAMGDMVAESSSFQAVVDAITQVPLEGWVKENADAIDGAMSAAMRTGIVMAKLLTTSMGGVVEVSVLAAHTIPAAWDDAIKGFEIAVHAAEAFSIQMRRAFTFNSEKARELSLEMDAVRSAAQRAAAEPWKLGDAAQAAATDVLAIDAAVTATLKGLDALSDRLGDTTRRRGTAAAPGDPKAAAAAAKAEQARQAAIAKAFEEVSEAQIALQEYQAGAEQMALDQLQAALDHQQQVWDGARRQMKAAAAFEQRLLDERARHWGAFSGAVDASLGAVIAGVEAFGASQETMAAVANVAVAAQAFTKAGWEVAEAIAAGARYDGWAAAQHWAAATQYGLVAGGAIAGGGSGGGGGGGGGVAPSAPPEPEPIRAAQRDTGGEMITYVQEIHYHGAVIQERQAARDISDLMGGSNRSGVSRFRGGR